MKLRYEQVLGFFSHLFLEAKGCAPTCLCDGITKEIVMVLHKHTNINNDYRIDISTARLAQECHTTTHLIRRRLAALLEIGFIEKVGSCKHNTNVYKFPEKVLYGITVATRRGPIIAIMADKMRSKMAEVTL